MEFITHSHRNGEALLEKKYTNLWGELKGVIENITDEDLKKYFLLKKNMSLSTGLNKILKERLSEKDWLPEAQIFQDPDYAQSREKAWRLDFAKEDISIEVSFNHGEALAWNLTKPVLASELNHVKKDIQTSIGVIILATDEMKKAGAFDSAVGSYEKAIRYLKPMNVLLSIPLVLIGLKAPKEFKIEKKKKNGKNIGIIKNLS